MDTVNSSFDRVVIGGGLFGCYAARVLADKGNRVLLIEQDDELLTRASYVNQARLHTGMHYPRSMLTASEALGYYERFKARFPETVRHFTQVYAVARYNSRTSGLAFKAFADRLGASSREIDPDRWFNKGTVDCAFVVDEPTFDAEKLRLRLTAELSEDSNVEVRTGTTALGGTVFGNSVSVHLSGDSEILTDGVVIAAYAGINGLRESFGLPLLPLTFELAEVLIGEVGPSLRDVGFTVMDGPFWSLMPFGHRHEVTLTSVGLTPLARADREAFFPCQLRRTGCTPAHLAECTTCHVRPPSGAAHQQQQMSLFLKDADEFTPVRSLSTVKAVLTATEVDDARPTLVYEDHGGKVLTVFSGKISTVFDLEAQLT